MISIPSGSGSATESYRIECDDAEFGRTLRAHFREAERRIHRRRLTICGSVIAILLVVNFAQLWLYIAALKVCGGGR